MASVVRGLVSKKKKRYQQGGFDLDLSYITPRMIAFGFPAEGAEEAYRNPMAEVKRFFDERHQGHYLIINLCSERSYPASKFDGNAVQFGFPDHCAPPFEILPKICEAAAAHLDKDENNVVGIHCKAGKGRTGMVISCLLMHIGQCATAQEALTVFGNARTNNGKGVTIPSQKRYVEYYEEYLRRKKEGTWSAERVDRKISLIRMIGIANFDVGGGCDPYVIIKDNDEREFARTEAKIFKKWKSDGFVDIQVHANIYGDVQFVFWDQDSMSKDDLMCWFWVNTLFIKPGERMILNKPEIDGASKDKGGHFPEVFTLEVCFDDALPTSLTVELPKDMVNAMRRATVTSPDALKK